MKRVKTPTTPSPTEDWYVKSAGELEDGSGYGWYVCRRGDEVFYTDNEQHAYWLAAKLNKHSPNFNPEER